MKKQIRPEEPQILKDNATKWNAQWQELRTRNPTASFAWYKHEKRSVREWILPVLREMNQYHGSFCDSFPIEASSNEPIEHFRPKSRHEFADQAYTWSNLYYCCERCQSFKKEKWDENLLCPDDREYLFSRFFIYDYTTGQMLPNPKASVADQTRAAVTIELYGLDTPPRRRQRKLALERWGNTTQQDPVEFAYRDYIELSV